MTEKRQILIIIIAVVTLCGITNCQFAYPFVVTSPGGEPIAADVSESQLSTGSTVETLFIPGSDKLGLDTESLIQNRYNCSDIAMTFNITDPAEPRAMELTITRLENNADNLICIPSGNNTDELTCTSSENDTHNLTCSTSQNKLTCTPSSGNNTDELTCTSSENDTQNLTCSTSQNATDELTDNLICIPSGNNTDELTCTSSENDTHNLTCSTSQNATDELTCTPSSVNNTDKLVCTWSGNDTDTLTCIPSDSIPCTIYWGDGENETIVIRRSGGIKVVEHTYAKVAVYDVHMSCTDRETRINCPQRKTDCVVTEDFLDEFHRFFTQPVKFFTSEPIMLSSYMELQNQSCVPDIKWTITHINVTTFTPFVDFAQPNTSSLRLKKESLEPGEYVISIDVKFPLEGESGWVTDSVVIKVVLSELVTHINGGEMLDVPYGGITYLDASISKDPSGNVTSVSALPLIATWKFAYYAVTPNVFEIFLKDFPDSPVPDTSISYIVTSGLEYALQINTAVFPAYTMAIAMFTLSRGTRASTAMQAVRFVPNAVPVSIACVYNCQVGYRVFNKDKIQLDAAVDESVDITTLTFKWEIKKWWQPLSFYTPVLTISSPTGYNTRSFGVTTGSVSEGEDIRLRLIISGGGYATTHVDIIRTVNRLPYAGTCSLDKTIVQSAREWLTLTCTNWFGNDARKFLNETADTNPILTYQVKQYTQGALVEEEPILNTRSKQSHLILKVGTPGTFATTINVHISDILKNSVIVKLHVQSNPAFDYASVTPTKDGADLVGSYTEVDYPLDEQQLQDMGKSDLLISLVSAVCSNLHLLDLPIWQPPVPRVLNSGGAILDLSPSGNTDVGTLDKAIEESENETVDPATAVVQEVMQSMVAGIRLVVETDLTGKRKGDKYLASIISNAFTNLAAWSHFTNVDTKVNLMHLSDAVGAEALDVPENTTEDLSAQIETTSGEVFFMARAVVNAVVPDNLKEIRPVEDLVAGRTQIEQMLAVIGGNISLNASALSSEERAYLYMRMQKTLALKNLDRKNSAREAAKMAIKMAQNVQEKLKVCKTCNNEDSENTKQLVTNNNARMLESSASSTETSLFRLDGLVNAVQATEANNDERILKRSVSSAVGDSSEASNEAMSVSAFEFTENVFMYDTDDTSSFVTSNVLRIDAKTSTERITPGYITFEQSVATPDATTIDPKETTDEEDASEFSYHKFIYGKNTDNVCLTIQPIGTYNFTGYSVYFKFKEPPSILEYDFMIKITEEEHWQYCVLPQQMNKHTGTIYFGVAVTGYLKETMYNLTLVTAGCMTWDEQEEKWYTDKCEFEWVPEYNKITCFCREVTDMIFANSFFVAPNSIDISTVFLKFSPLNQAAVMSAIGGIILIYFIAVLFLKGLDRRDQVKWGITALRDNYVTDQQYYLIKVFTGMRRGAGTRSRVAFILTGATGETGPRELFDGIREEFSTGSVMTYFMATTEDLGHLEHLYIWHDNSGENDFASWYLNQVAVYDIERKESYTFCAERWFSVDSIVDANLVGTDANTPMEFESRFFYQTRDRLSESHMWLSILYRPSLSTFTRVQRASCALVYIFLNMIANAMYFNPTDDYQTPPLVQVGPFRFTPQQIFISIMCALITTPPVILLIFLFKRTKRRPGSSCCACCKCACACCAGSMCCRSEKALQKRQHEDMVRSKLLSEEMPDFSGGHYLPSWCIGFAWFLVVVGTVIPAFFILLYSMEWGKQKSEEWLTTFLMSLVESMLFVDPIMRYFIYMNMVICIAFVLACLIRSSKNDTNIDMSIVVQNYKQSMGFHQDDFSSSILLLKKLRDEYLSYISMPRFISPPLQGDSLCKAASDHQHQSGLVTIFRDILLNLFFIFIILSICYGSRDDRSYAHHEEMINQIVTPWKKPYFEQIKTPGDVFNWVNVTVIPSLFPENDINGSPLHWYYRQFATGYNFMRLGPPRLRQMRTTKGRCTIPYIGTVDCYGEYTILGEDETDYCIGWTPQPCTKFQDAYNVSGEAWTFTSALDVWGLPIPAFYTTYGGGGYIVQFDVSRKVSVEIVNELFRNLWLDRQTRAVFFEFTLYAPSTNIFIYNIFIVEFPQTGGAFTTYSIYPVRVYNHVGPMGSFTLVCEVVFVIYMVVLLVKMCIRFYQQRCKFFTVFWQVYELIMFIVGVTAIAMYAIKLGMTYVTIAKYRGDIKLFVNFAHLIFWDQMLVTFLAILVFMATLRMLEVFASSKKVSAIVEIFKHCGKDLFWYGMSFLHMLLGFCFLGYFLFGKQLLHYMDILECLTTLCLALIGKSTYSDITATQPILAQVFFMLYVLTVVFFTLTLFLSILGASINNVIHDTREDQREDLIEHIMKKFKSVFTKPDANSGRRCQKGGRFMSENLLNRLFYEPPKSFEPVPICDSDVPPVHRTLDTRQVEELINNSKLPRKMTRRRIEPIASDS